MDIKSIFKKEPPVYVSETLQLLIEHSKNYKSGTKDSETITMLMGAITLAYFDILNQE